MILSDSGTDTDSALEIPGSLSDTTGSPVSASPVEAQHAAQTRPRRSVADSVNRRLRAMG